ncbi:MAG: hypothetical protein ACFFB5_22485 [Promethearchaeota archaeon]
MPIKERKRTTFTSATIAAAAFNLPVMVIAGLIIGYLLSANQESPLRELLLIGTPIIFFTIAVIELYYAASKQQFQRLRSRSSYGELAELITAEDEEE